MKKFRVLNKHKTFLEEKKQEIAFLYDKKSKNIFFFNLNFGNIHERESIDCKLTAEGLLANKFNYYRPRDRWYDPNPNYVPHSINSRIRVYSERVSFKNFLSLRTQKIFCYSATWSNRTFKKIQI